MDDPVIKSFDFLNEDGKLHGLLINLLNENETLLNSLEMQVDLAKIIESLKKMIKKIYILQPKKKRKEKVFWSTNQRHTELSPNWLKQNQIINWFTKNNIISKSGKFADAPKKIAESKLKESEQNSDQSISKFLNFSINF